jgi:hypothetical protein
MIAFVSLVAAGCGSEAEPASHTGSTTDTATTVDGATVEESVDATDATSMASESDDTAGSDCAPDEAPQGPSVTFTLRNLRSDAIFVVSWLGCVEGYVRLDLVDDPPGRWPLDACAPTCANIIAGECWDCACEPPRLLRVEPGASYDVVWDGQLWIDAELPTECNACAVASDCLLGVSAPAHTYLITSTAATSATDCVDEMGGSSCTCPNGAQACFIEGTVANPAELPVQANLEYPDATSLELAFD